MVQVKKGKSRNIYIIKVLFSHDIVIRNINKKSKELTMVILMNMNQVLRKVSKIHIKLKVVSKNAHNNNMT